MMCLFNKKEAVNESSGNVKVLGSGCKKCHELEQSVQTALNDLNINETVDHVTDIAEIAKYGVMSTPALVINEEVVSYGKVLNVEEAKAILQEKL
ncbi:thioredoxin family protein [Macrococcus sp. EM39E]|uniref:thioredoxin family protein n=1 Tax=Macrococcus animalis TaxID=3395467 RepID=UPI0039BE4AF5